MLRAINGTRIKDKASVKSMLTKFNLLSVYQLAAQIRLLEVWKAINVESYALSFELYKKQQPEHEDRIESLMTLPDYKFPSKVSTLMLLDCGTWHLAK